MLTRREYISRPLEMQEELLALFAGNPPRIIFDVGSCEGEDSIRYAELFPEARVYSFEPRTDNFEFATRLVNKYGKKNIHLEQLALSDRNGTADFYLSAGEPHGLSNDENWNYGNKSSSLLPPSDEMKKHTAWLEFGQRTVVPTMRLDDYVRKNNISAIDLMHIDVQGAEMMVFKGAGSFFRNIKVIWTEVEAVQLYMNQPVKRDIEAFMQANGFTNILDTVGEVAGDQLYVNMKYFDSSLTASILNRRKWKSRMARLKSFIGFRK